MADWKGESGSCFQLTYVAQKRPCLGTDYLSSVYMLWKKFFQCGNFFSPAISLQESFPLEISLQVISFWNQPYAPQKSNGQSPKANKITYLDEVIHHFHWCFIIMSRNSD